MLTAWWHIPIRLGGCIILRRLRWEGSEFEASLDYLLSPRVLSDSEKEAREGGREDEARKQIVPKSQSLLSSLNLS